MNEIFKALADPGRRQLLDSLRAHDGQTLRSLCAGMRMARQSVSKHLALLESAGLVVTVRHGREKLHYLNPAPINEIAGRWITQYDQPRLEASRDARAFVYQTYIRTSPAQLWRALTEPVFTERYWGGLSFDTDWAAGSTMARIADVTVTFDIEDLGEAVKLTVLHSNFEAGSTAATMVRDGWPRVISDLKSLLETGEPLPLS